MSEPKPIDAERMLRVSEAAERVGLSTRTLLRQVAAGTFPAPYKVSESRQAWKASEISAWIDSCERVTIKSQEAQPNV